MMNRDKQTNQQQRLTPRYHSKQPRNRTGLVGDPGLSPSFSSSQLPRFASPPATFWRSAARSRAPAEDSNNLQTRLMRSLTCFQLTGDEARLCSPQATKTMASPRAATDSSEASNSRRRPHTAAGTTRERRNVGVNTDSTPIRRFMHKIGGRPASSRPRRGSENFTNVSAALMRNVKVVRMKREPKKADAEIIGVAAATVGKRDLFSGMRTVDDMLRQQAVKTNNTNRMKTISYVGGLLRKRGAVTQSDSRRFIPVRYPPQI